MVLSLLLVAFSGCPKPDNSGKDTFKERQGQPGFNSGERPEQPTTPIAVEPAKLGDISSYYTATATLAAEKEAVILARVSGIVESLDCEEGDRVRKGQTLLTVGDQEYRFRLQQAETNVVDLKSRFERLKMLKDQKMVSVEEYERVQNDLESARAEEGLAQLTLSYTRVTAPFDGVIVSRYVDVGQNVNSSTQLFSLSDFDPLLARVHVPSKEFKKLLPDQAVELILESNKQRLQGHIKLISPVIDPTSGTIKVTVEIHQYPQDVRPGDFAEVLIVTEHRTERTLVPSIALVNQRGEQLIYVAKDGLAESRPVEIGFTDTDFTEIVSGVSPGEKVIVKGQRLLKHGAPIKILGDETVEPHLENSETKPANRMKNTPKRGDHSTRPKSGRSKSRRHAGS